MSLRRTISNAVDTAFKASGDLVDHNATHIRARSSAGTFNAETEERGADPATHGPVRLLVTETNQFIPDQSDVRTTLRNLLTPAADYPANAQPEDGDAIQGSDGNVWRLRRILSPPGAALLKIEARLEG